MLSYLIELLKRYIRRLTEESLAARASGNTVQAAEVDSWLDAMQRLLVRYTIAAYMAGSGSPTLDSKAKEAVGKAVKVQFEYLQGFAFEIKEDGEFNQGWLNRAESYANAVVVPYWQGRTKMLPLPAMPAQGTQCLGQCRCEWRVKRLAGDGNYDCYWQLEPKADNCQTCAQRAEEWSPLKIREGRLVLG